MGGGVLEGIGRTSLTVGGLALPPSVWACEVAWGERGGVNELSNLSSSGK